MVKARSTTNASDRRERPRSPASHAVALGGANLNPFGDLHTVQHLSARFARSLRAVVEPLLRREVRVWAEPLVVQRFADYRAERPDGLTAWLALRMTPEAGTALAVIDGRFLLQLMDLFFGGTGIAPATLPTEFSPAAEAMARRLGDMIARPLAAAWEPLARIGFEAAQVEANPAMFLELDSDDALVVTRFGIAHDADAPVFLDLVYPVAALKPHGPSLTGKVHGKSAEPDAAWRSSLTRAALGVRLPVRSVLAEPVIPLSRLIALKAGDVIPISFGAEVPVMIGSDLFASGTVGAANGRTAIRINTIHHLSEDER